MAVRWLQVWEGSHGDRPTGSQDSRHLLLLMSWKETTISLFKQRCGTRGCDELPNWTELLNRKAFLERLSSQVGRGVEARAVGKGELGWKRLGQTQK